MTTAQVSAETDGTAKSAATANLVRGSSLYGLRLIQYALVLVANVVVSRVLGTVGRAQYALPLNLASMVWVAVNLSLDISTGAMLARGEAALAELSGFLSAAVAALGLLGIAVTLAIGLSTDDSLLAHGPYGGIVLAAFTVPLMLAVQMTTGLLVRLGELRAYGWATAIGSAAQLAFVVVLTLARDLTPELALAGTALGFAATAAALLIVLARRAGLRALAPTFDRPIARRALGGGLAVHPATLGLYLNLRADLFIVGALTSARETGLYSLSVAFASIVFLAVMTLTASAARTQTEEPLDIANRYTLDFVRTSWMAALMVTLVIAVSAWPAIRVVFGAAWTGSAVPLIILTAAIVALSVEPPVRIMLMRMSRPRWISAAACAGMLINIGLNFILIPLFGIIGAALASLASYSFYALLMLALFSRASGLEIRYAFIPRRDDPFVKVLWLAANRVKALLDVSAHLWRRS